MMPMAPPAPMAPPVSAPQKSEVKFVQCSCNQNPTIKQMARCSYCCCVFIFACCCCKEDVYECPVCGKRYPDVCYLPF